MRINLEWIVKYHNESRRLLSRQIDEIDEEIKTCSDEERQQELIYAKTIYSTTFDQMLRSNTFLMMYSYLEEFLYLVQKHFSKETNAEGKGSIKRFKSVFKESLGIDLEKDPDWQFISDCEKSRDCLLHANGRVDLSKNRAEIEKIVSRSHGLLKVDQQRIVLTGEFIKKVSIVLRNFIAKVESRRPA